MISVIGLLGRVFANGPGDLGSIPGRVIPKTLKMGLDSSRLNTQQYEVRIKGKVEQSRQRSGALPYTSVLQLLKREPYDYPRQQSHTFFNTNTSKQVFLIHQWAPNRYYPSGLEGPWG